MRIGLNGHMQTAKEAHISLHCLHTESLDTTEYTLQKGQDERLRMRRVI